MAIKFFCIYLGVFLVCSIALFAVVKNFAEGFAGSSKKPLLFGGLSSLLASGGAFLATWVSTNLFVVFWFLAGIFFLMGIVNLLLFHRKYFNSSNKSKYGKLFTGEILFSLSLIFFTVIIFSSLHYFLKDRHFFFYPMLLSLLAFFLPMLVVRAFDAAYDIPAPVYHTWHYPIHAPIDLPDEKANEKLLVIAFELGKNATDKVRTNFRAKGPDNMKLGDLYYHFINDYNEVQSETPIQYARDGYDAHEWWFRRKKRWYQKHVVFDPELSLDDNDIKENTVIICERLKD